MFKMIIVDDQPSVVKGISNSIKWNEIGIQIIETAKNGEEGLDKILKLVPDIVITDIQMPVMDGLEMIKKCKKNNLNVKFVILSAYGEFEYAKKAVEFGVMEYILKPVLAKDIKASMEKIVEECRKSKEDEMLAKQLEMNMPIIRENFILTLLDDDYKGEYWVREQANYLKVDLSVNQYRVISVEIDNYPELLDDKDSDKIELIKIDIVKQICDSLGIINTYTNFKGNKASFLLVGKMDTENLSNALNNIIHDINKKYDVSITVGVGNETDGIEGISKSYRQSLETAKYKFQFGNGQLMFFNDLVYTRMIVSEISFINYEKLTDSFKSYSKELAKGHLCSMLEKIKSNPYVSDDYVKTIFHEFVDIMVSSLYHMGEKLPDSLMMPNKRWELIENVTTLEEAEKIIVNMLDEAFEILGKKQYDRNSRIIEQITKYIEDNHTKDVTIEELSEIIYLTPNYIGKLFSKATGKTVNEYLHEYRIKKAKKLILENKYKIQEIAYMVGYKRGEYFAQKFKEYTGQIPSKYIGR